MFSWCFGVRERDDDRSEDALECSQSNNTRRIHAVSPSPSRDGPSIAQHGKEPPPTMAERTKSQSKLHPHHEQRKKTNSQITKKWGEPQPQPPHDHHLSHHQSLLLDRLDSSVRESAHERNRKRNGNVTTVTPQQRKSQKKDTMKNTKHISQLIR